MTLLLWCLLFSLKDCCLDTCAVLDMEYISTAGEACSCFDPVTQRTEQVACGELSPKS